MDIDMKETDAQGPEGKVPDANTHPAPAPPTNVKRPRRVLVDGKWRRVPREARDEHKPPTLNRNDASIQDDASINPEVKRPGRLDHLFPKDKETQDANRAARAAARAEKRGDKPKKTRSRRVMSEHRRVTQKARKERNYQRKLLVRKMEGLKVEDQSEPAGKEMH